MLDKKQILTKLFSLPFFLLFSPDVIITLLASENRMLAIFYFWSIVVQFSLLLYLIVMLIYAQCYDFRYYVSALICDNV